MVFCTHQQKNAHVRTLNAFGSVIIWFPVTTLSYKCVVNDTLWQQSEMLFSAVILIALSSFQLCSLAWLVLPDSRPSLKNEKVRERKTSPLPLFTLFFYLICGQTWAHKEVVHSDKTPTWRLSFTLWFTTCTKRKSDWKSHLITVHGQLSQIKALF